jgi:hypothetical protein
MRKTRSGAATFLIFILAGVAFLPNEVANAAPPPQAQAKIGGQWVPVTVGTVVAQGVLADESCTFVPPLALQGAAGIQVGLHVDGNCVASIDVVRAVPGPSSPPAGVQTDPLPSLQSPDSGSQESYSLATAVNHYMWAKATVQEQFGVMSSEVYVEMKYTRDGGHLYNGNSPGYYDDTSSWPCWTVTPEAYNWNPNGPSSVFIYRRTHFRNCSPPHPDYDLSARATADPSPRHTCNTPAVPTFWDVRCNGGIYY